MPSGHNPPFATHSGGMNLDPNMPVANEALLAGRLAGMRLQNDNTRLSTTTMPAPPQYTSPPIAYGRTTSSSAPSHPPGLAQAVVSRGELPPEFIPAFQQEMPRKPSISEHLKEQLRLHMAAQDKTTNKADDKEAKGQSDKDAEQH